MFQKQDPMRFVSWSTIPMALWAIYLYGWRVVAVFLVVLPIAIISEFIFENQRKKKVTEAVFVTSILYALSMPPGVPLWVAGIGICFGVIFGKELFGGFGRNIFNPAIVGRLFVYVSFPVMMQTPFIQPGHFGMNGISFSQSSYISTIPESIFMIVVCWGLFFLITSKKEKPMAFVVPLITGVVIIIAGYITLLATGMITKPEIKVVTDTMASATPLVKYKMGASVQDVGFLNLFLGRRTGMIGEGSILLILLAFLYLISPLTKKVVNLTLSLSTYIFALLLFSALYYTDSLKNILPQFSPVGKDTIGQMQDIFGYMFSGSLVYICVFMVTDPVSSPNKTWSRIFYGAIIGCSTILIRLYSVFPEGVSFAIVLGNMFGPLLDKVMPKDKPKKKASSAKSASKTAGGVK